MARNYVSHLNNVLRAITEAEERALLKVGIFVQGEAQDRSPVGQYDDGRVGGNLRDSNSYQVVASEKKVIVGNSASYAPYVELGTHKMSAQPFLQPSVDENRNRLQQLISEEFENL